MSRVLHIAFYTLAFSHFRTFALYSHPRLVVMKPQCMLTGDLADKPTRGMPTPGQTNSRKIQVTDNPVGEQLC